VYVCLVCGKYFQVRGFAGGRAAEGEGLLYRAWLYDRAAAAAAATAVASS
jgi:hypothetical protein